MVLGQLQSHEARSVYLSTYLDYLLCIKIIHPASQFRLDPADLPRGSAGYVSQTNKENTETTEHELEAGVVN